MNISWDAIVQVRFANRPCEYATCATGFNGRNNPGYT